MGVSHGDTFSIGTGSAQKEFSFRGAISNLKAKHKLNNGCRVIRREGAPIPLKPLGRWDNGADTLLVGDAAGVVAPSSGEGIYYAMLSGKLAARALTKCVHEKFQLPQRTTKGVLKTMERFFSFFDYYKVFGTETIH